LNKIDKKALDFEVGIRKEQVKFEKNK